MDGVPLSLVVSYGDRAGKFRSMYVAGSVLVLNVDLVPLLL